MAGYFAECEFRISLGNSHHFGSICLEYWQVHSLSSLHSRDSYDPIKTTACQEHFLQFILCRGSQTPQPVFFNNRGSEGNFHGMFVVECLLDYPLSWKTSSIYQTVGYFR
ncbi:hypothetical protein AHF37_03415 [Paragonimus kellicotti]|nr:hypothetical protein AHF37_03415 [Paragonimus kellicotti]